MIERKSGNIINVASSGGRRASPGLGAYSISKAGVIMLTQVLAQELGAHGIRVNAIAPGIIQTRFAEALWSNEAILKRDGDDRWAASGNRRRWRAFACGVGGVKL
jgi:NAD(P)-dependent dehydrogenase (short-subunit alcohol dehydrogenase family)